MNHKKTLLFISVLYVFMIMIVVACQHTTNSETANNVMVITTVEKDFYVEASIEDIREDTVLFKTENGQYYEIPMDLLAPYGRLRIGDIISLQYDESISDHSYYMKHIGMVPVTVVTVEEIAK